MSKDELIAALASRRSCRSTASGGGPALRVARGSGRLHVRDDQALSGPAGAIQLIVASWR